MILTGVLSDQPTIIDKFNYQKAATTLADIIKDKNTDTPLTVGIFGEWGTGKTSFLRMVEAKIQDGQYPTVWFDPWRYDDRQMIQEAFIQTILAKMDSDHACEGFQKEVAELTLRFLALIAAKTVEIGTAGAVRPWEIGEDAREIIKPRFERIRQWNEIEQSFAQVVHRYLGDTTKKLVIFIDDLDRCLPENAIQVLEAIKLFLAQKNCVFVLGVDKQGIEAAIKLRYKDNPQLTGVKYLEKIIQLPFSLPRPNRESITTYVKELFGEFRTEEALSVLEAGADGNPRRIKRFINALRLLGSIASGDLEEAPLAKIVMLQLRFPEFYQFLCGDPDAIDNLIEHGEETEALEILGHNTYKKYVEQADLIAFLSKTKDIFPKQGFWDSYLKFSAMYGIENK